MPHPSHYDNNVGLPTKIFYSTYPTTNINLVVSTSPIIVHAIYFSAFVFATLNVSQAIGTGSLNRIYTTIPASLSVGRTVSLTNNVFEADDGLQFTHPVAGIPSLGSSYEVMVFYSQVGR